MMPAEPSQSEVQKLTDSEAADPSGQLEQPRQRRRAARKRRAPAREQRPESKSGMLAFAFAEFQRLREQGETPDIQQFCDCFPECRSSLRRMLDLENLAVSHLDRSLPNSNDESINWPFEGDRREDFTIIRELARGTFARVYLATEASTGG